MLDLIFISVQCWFVFINVFDRTHTNDKEKMNCYFCSSMVTVFFITITTPSIVVNYKFYAFDQSVTFYLLVFSFYSWNCIFCLTLYCFKGLKFTFSSSTVLIIIIRISQNRVQCL